MGSLHMLSFGAVCLFTMVNWQRNVSLALFCEVRVAKIWKTMAHFVNTANMMRVLFAFIARQVFAVNKNIGTAVGSRLTLNTAQIGLISHEPELSPLTNKHFHLCELQKRRF